MIGNGGWSRVGGCRPGVKCVYTVREIGNRRGNRRHEGLEQLLHVGELLCDDGLVKSWGCGSWLGRGATCCCCVVRSGGVSNREGTCRWIGVVVGGCDGCFFVGLSSVFPGFVDVAVGDHGIRGGVVVPGGGGLFAVSARHG